MKRNRPTFYTLIVLIVLFSIFSVYGYILKSDGSGNIVDNPNKEFYYKNKLYFYKKDNLLGKYDCVSDNCGYASSMKEDIIIYPYDGILTTLGIINNRYAFIEDDNKIYLFDIISNKNLIEFDGIKYYDSNIENNLLIAKKDDKWGVLSLDNLQTVVPFSYESISLANNVLDNVLKSDKFLVSNGNEYFLINNKNEVISKMFSSKIIDYNDKFVITKSEAYKIYDYEGNQVISQFVFTNYNKVSDYYVFRYNNYVLVYNDLSNKYLKYYDIDVNLDYDIRLENNDINIYVNDVLQVEK